MSEFAADGRGIAALLDVDSRFAARSFFYHREPSGAEQAYASRSKEENPWGIG
jgi:hypothetical protein